MSNKNNDYCRELVLAIWLILVAIPLGTFLTATAIANAIASVFRQ